MEGKVIAFSETYSNKRVLVTGHTGFKGSWLCQWLLELGAKVAGYSINTPTQPSNFETLGLESQIKHITGDVRNSTALQEAINFFKPDIIFQKIEL